MAIPDTSIINIYLDKNTEAQFIKLLNGTGSNNYLDCVINPGMNIMVVVKPKENKLVSLIYALQSNRRAVNAYDINGLYAYPREPKSQTTSFSYKVADLQAGRYQLQLEVYFPGNTIAKSRLHTNDIQSKTYGEGYYVINYYDTLSTPADEILVQFNFGDIKAFIQQVRLYYLG